MNQYDIVVSFQLCFMGFFKEFIYISFFMLYALMVISKHPPFVVHSCCWYDGLS
jgi:hypothetical protein